MNSHFDSRPVAHEQVLRMLEAARWSPSSGNGQPWHFLVVSHADAHAFDRAMQSLNAGNVIWAQQAPLLLLAVARVQADDGTPNRTALYGSGAGSRAPEHPGHSFR